MPPMRSKPTSATAPVRDGTKDWWNSSVKATESTSAIVSRSGRNHSVETEGLIALQARTARMRYSRM